MHNGRVMHFYINISPNVNRGFYVYEAQNCRSERIFLVDSENVFTKTLLQERVL
jgi:hypothetical protein